MNAHTSLPSAEALATASADSPHYQTQRHDGWTPERQRTFLERIADGYTVAGACQAVAMQPSGAYQFRRRAHGAAFALGWAAANLIARDILADTLINRAIDGYSETVTRPNGDTVERHRYDNRLALSMLRRLDEQAAADNVSTQAARLIAQDFDAYLTMIERDGGPARAGLFLGARAEAAADLDPIRALGRAERFVRSGAGTPGEVETGDLDPVQREGWSSEQWNRAEAAGIVAITPDPEPELEESASGRADCAISFDPSLHEPVWWDDERRAWHTYFPPPEDFIGHEEGDYGDEGYERELTEEEEAVMEARKEAEIAEQRATEMAEYDRWFGKPGAVQESGDSADLPENTGESPSPAAPDHASNAPPAASVQPVSAVG